MNRFQNILYVMGNQNNEPSPSLMRAVSLAKNNQADLTLLAMHTKTTLPLYAQGIGIDENSLQQRIKEREEEALTKLSQALEKEIETTILVRSGKKYIESIRVVQAHNFDLVIKEADEYNWLDHLIVSDDMHLLRQCPCPVWLMKKESEKENYQRIMAAVDFDTENDETENEQINEVIVDLASSLSLSNFTSLDIVNVYDVPQAGFISLWAEQPDKIERKLFESEHRLRQQKMDGLLYTMQQQLGDESYEYVSPRSHTIQGIAGQEIPKFAKENDIDLVIMGTVARSGIAGVLIGNTAETVLSQLQCSVLAIKPPGFVSPEL